MSLVMTVCLFVTEGWFLAPIFWVLGSSAIWSAAYLYAGGIDRLRGKGVVHLYSRNGATQEEMSEVLSDLATRAGKGLYIGPPVSADNVAIGNCVFFPPDAVYEDVRKTLEALAEEGEHWSGGEGPTEEKGS